MRRRLTDRIDLRMGAGVMLPLAGIARRTNNDALLIHHHGTDRDLATLTCGGTLSKGAHHPLAVFGAGGNITEHSRRAVCDRQF